MLGLIVTEGPLRGKTFELSDARTHTIGRSGTLPLMDAGLSRHHAEFVCEDGEWVIQDLGSTNGTSVNHARVSGRTVLNTTDRIQVGSTVLVVARISPDLTFDRSAPHQDERGSAAGDTSSGTRTTVLEPESVPGLIAPPPRSNVSRIAASGGRRRAPVVPPAVWVLAALTLLTLIGLLIDVWLYTKP